MYASVCEWRIQLQLLFPPEMLLSAVHWPAVPIASCRRSNDAVARVSVARTLCDCGSCQTEATKLWNILKDTVAAAR